MKYFVLICLAILCLGGCAPEEKQVEYTNLPYPADKDIQYYQSATDSGYQKYWIDIKAVTSAYLNNSKYNAIKVTPENIIIVGEGLFHGTIDVEMPDFILELKLERPNKPLGRKSIWQVKEAKELPWTE